MSALLLVLLPAVAILGLGVRAVRTRATLLLLGVALLASLLAAYEAALPSGASRLAGWVFVDATSRLFLAIINPIFFGISAYVWSRVSTTPALEVGIGRFVGRALLFLAASNAVLIANHALTLWIALEVTTFALAPLIVRAGVPASRLASWRYLLFSSVGLGLTFLGMLCLGRGIEGAGEVPTLLFDRLGEVGHASVNTWGKLGLSLVLLGLGAKLGLVPMYSWLPEAYDEAPPSVTALLGAIQFNVALVMLMRVVFAFRSSHAGLITTTLVAMGLASMLISTFSIIATRNVKRLVAYASINHAGVIAIGLGVGKDASYGLLLYVVSNAFIKAILFLTVGKIEAHYGTKDTREIAGLLKDLPYSGLFLMVGTFALLGFPPFGSFFGELLILSALVGANHMLVFATFCVLITMTFVATGRTIFPMIWGEPKQRRSWPQQTLVQAVPKLFFLTVLVVLGVYIPRVVDDLLGQVAQAVAGP